MQISYVFQGAGLVPGKIGKEDIVSAAVAGERNLLGVNYENLF